MRQREDKGNEKKAVGAGAGKNGEIQSGGTIEDESRDWLLFPNWTRAFVVTGDPFMRTDFLEAQIKTPASRSLFSTSPSPLLVVHHVLLASLRIAAAHAPPHLGAQHPSPAAHPPRGAPHPASSHRLPVVGQVQLEHYYQYSTAGSLDRRKRVWHFDTDSLSSGGQAKALSTPSTATRAPLHIASSTAPTVRSLCIIASLDTREVDSRGRHSSVIAEVCTTVLGAIQRGGAHTILLRSPRQIVT